MYLSMLIAAAGFSKYLGYFTSARESGSAQTAEARQLVRISRPECGSALRGRGGYKLPRRPAGSSVYRLHEWKLESRYETRLGWIFLSKTVARSWCWKNVVKIFQRRLIVSLRTRFAYLLPLPYRCAGRRKEEMARKSRYRVITAPCVPYEPFMNYWIP